MSVTRRVATARLVRCARSKKFETHAPNASGTVDVGHVSHVAPRGECSWPTKILNGIN